MQNCLLDERLINIFQVVAMLSPSESKTLVNSEAPGKDRKPTVGVSASCFILILTLTDLKLDEHINCVFRAVRLGHV